MIRRILASSRYFIAFAVLGAFLAAVVLMVFGTLLVIDIALDATFDQEMSPNTAKHLAVEYIELIDLFLLATVLYIVALGLYSLFIDDELPMPRWLQVSNLDDLKEKLVGVIVVLLGVNFLGEVVDWDGLKNIFYFGAGIALVIASLALYAGISHHIHKSTAPHSQPLPPAQPETKPLAAEQEPSDTAS